MFFVFVFIFQEFVLCVESWSMRRWYRHLVGFGRKALSLLFEGVFQSEIPRVDGRGGEGEKECEDGTENDIRAAAPTGGQLDNTDADTQQLFPRRNVIDKM
jgi:hypothetical protein